MKMLSITDRPTIACIEEIHPFSLGGYWIPEMVHTAGGKVIGGKAGEPPAPTIFDEIREANPDVILFHLRGVHDPVHVVTTLLRDWSWSELRAVRENRVAVGKDVYFNDFGPRLIDGIEAIAELLHPGVFTTYSKEGIVFEKPVK
jgi:iron complex transport system substrate-binding protein